ncbi:NRDE2 isoform 9 [Pan troglodytes]|uniref:NRDE-2, necessary for RNA interference, domain containing n=7 Tax=Hominoidea TaxID=314295 RepID=G3V338_HUMAN|nr:NRDE2 isoform 9 [Pan troglodytes]PNJ64921.1 NRDE2 isoform 4 [Pongo abelii]
MALFPAFAGLSEAPDGGSSRKVKEIMLQLILDIALFGLRTFRL